MGFFSELFSKQTCAFCGSQVGAMSRKKMQDKNFICKECQKNCSAFIEPSAFNTEFLKNHMVLVRLFSLFLSLNNSSLTYKTVDVNHILNRIYLQ